MDKHSNNILIKRLEEKNIQFQPKEKSKFNNYSYYQVINAYKSLFVSKVETIEDIHNNIINGIDIEEYKNSFGINANTDLFREICKKISKKYGLLYNDNMKELQLIKNIKDIKYVHHVYPIDTQYGDFLRMYKFEHELRLLLLRYTLIIEESVKNIFIKHLNNSTDVKANFLSDINSYDTSKGNNFALDTLKLVLEKQKNKHSKPISRKRDQNLTIPYWIIINELSMNETYNVISNLKPERKEQIFQACVNHFTKVNIDINDKTKNPNRISKEKGLIKSFTTLIAYIGKFRNMLAHNQPIFCYNHKDISLENFPNMNFELPRITNASPNIPIRIQQSKINSVTMYDFVEFFGSDYYNRHNSNKDINLAFMIYLIYKMISTVDKNTKFYDELIELFAKYNIIIIKKEEMVVSTSDKVNELISEIEVLNSIEIDYNYFVSKIDNKLPYKKDLKSLSSRYDSQKRKINNIANSIKMEVISSKYNKFKHNNRYTIYTGIDKNFLINLK